MSSVTSLSLPKKIGVSVLALLGITALGAVFFAYSSLPKVKGKVYTKDIATETLITRDSKGIPYIEAKTDEEAYFALGFAHAQDRLFQMELMRRAGSGRLSEIFGEKALDHDRYIRTLGFHLAAPKSYENLSPIFQKTLEAYAKGINAYLKTHQGALPLEFYLLGFRPEPWRPQDSLLWGKQMALTLSHNWKEDFLRARILKKTNDPQILKHLWPSIPLSTPVTLEGLKLEALNKLAKRLPHLGEGSMASNAWIVGGQKSETGKPLLANDPHLKLSLPGPWYLAHIKTPSLTLAGATSPGVPLMILGHNSSIAWGFTTTTGDTQDLFIEKVDEQNKSHYKTPEGSKPFETRLERISVKGFQNDVRFDVRSTRHGVVISDYQEHSSDILENDHVLALSWPGLDLIDKTMEGLFEVNHAKNWQEFTHGLEKVKSPQQNIHYADIQGNIGFYAPALIPMRKKGDGTLPVPGWTGEYDWNGFIPFQELPHSFNPASNSIANANNKIVDDSYKHHISFDWDNPAARAIRLQELLERQEKHSMNSFSEIQNDILSLVAMDFKGLLTEVAFKNDYQTAARNLIAWDGVMDKNKAEPLMYVAWMEALHRKVLKPYLGDFYKDYLKWRPAALKSILVQNKSRCSELEENVQKQCLQTLQESFEEGYDTLKKKHGSAEKWRYGKAHFTHLEHPIFSQIPLLGKLTSVHFETSGDKHTLNEAMPEMINPKILFRQVHGPSFRGIYDLSALENSRFMILPGQSGHPFSSNWKDLGLLWQKGDYVKLNAKDLKDGKKLSLIPLHE
jgi:penicillin G amidase